LALLLACAAGAAYCQNDPYGPPPRPQDPYDAGSGQPDDDWRETDDDWGQTDDDWRQPDDSYDRQGDYGYDGDDRRGPGPALDVGFFYDELSPYGEWLRHPRYGWVWFPRQVQAGWRPYSLGRWVESDYGWTWDSYEPFGWATYHYGRWAWDRQVGWLWVPGTDWGPAWVAWQQGNGYVGWAPLPPAVGFEIGFGIRLGNFNLQLGISPRQYAFVEESRFLDSRIGGYIVPEARNVTIFNRTTNITDYSVVNDRVINRGVPVERIERATGRRAPRLRVGTASSPRGGGVQRDVINIYRPSASRLGTVRVGRRNNAGLPQEAPRPNRTEERYPGARPPASEERNPGTRPPASTERYPPARPPADRPRRDGRSELPILVAPRAESAPRPVDERQFVREQNDLRAREAKERRDLEEIHRRELAQAQAQSNASEVRQRQAAEMQAQKEEREREEQQLQTRQQLQRQAARARESKDKGKQPRKPPVPGKPEEKKDRDGQRPPRSW
jgi:hypothetical protein